MASKVLRRRARVPAALWPREDSWRALSKRVSSVLNAETSPEKSAQRMTTASGERRYHAIEMDGTHASHVGAGVQKPTDRTIGQQQAGNSACCLKQETLRQMLAQQPQRVLLPAQYESRVPCGVRRRALREDWLH